LETALRQRRLVLSPPAHQDDQAYAQNGWHYGLSKLGVPFARLRTQAGRHLFTLKRPVDNEMACMEFETEVADRDQMHEAILNMGFYPTVRIVKTRRTARLGELSLCVDQVEDLGVFLEIERVIQAGESGAAVQAELDGFARSLGVPLERTTDTYDSLVRASLAAV
jgi:adenylate cyclase class 2